MATPLSDTELFQHYLAAYALGLTGTPLDARVLRPLGEETDTRTMLALVLGLEDAMHGSRRAWPEVKAAVEAEVKASGVE